MQNSITIYNKLKHNNLLLFACIAVVNLIVWYALGMFDIKISPDGKYYLSQADYIEINGIRSFISGNSSIPYYWGFPLYLYFVKCVFGSFFLVVIWVIQFLMMCLIPLLLKGIYTVIFKSHNGSLLICFLFMFSWDILQWGNFLLTDTYSLFLTVLFVYLLLRHKNFTLTTLIPSVLILATLLLIFRASNILVLLPSAIFFFCLDRKGKAISLMVLLVIGVFCYQYYPKKQGAYNVNARYNLFEKNMKSGEIINDRHYYNIKPLNNGQSTVIYAFKLYIIRLINYFRFYDSTFSLSHNLFNLLYFPLCYLFFIIWFLRKKMDGYPTSNQNYILVIISLYIMSTIFTMIDYDWRYRVPALTFLLLFSARGLYIFLLAISKITSTKPLKVF